MLNKKRNIIVTGGCGFIGSHLIKKLDKLKNYHITNIDNLSYASSLNSLKSINNDNYTHIDIDISQYDDFESLLKKYKPIKFFHLAAESHVDRSIDGPKTFIDTNIYGTFNILEGIKKYFFDLSDTEKEKFILVHVSTDEVYGSVSNGQSSERDNIQPNSPYSSSKAASDLLVRAWNKTFKLPVIITRSTNNYGPWQYPEKLIPVVINNIINNNKIPLYGDGQQSRDWIHVQDHVEALVMLSDINRDKIGEIYNIGTNNVISNLDLVKLICSICDKEIPKENNSYSDLIEFVDDRPGHDIRYSLNNSKLVNDLGWSPKVEFEDGIKNTIKWYLDNHNSLQEYFNSKYDNKRIGLGK